MPSRDTEFLSVDQPLFPVSGQVPGGTERKTHKMIERDLMAARDQWLDEAKTDAEKLERLRSDFLCYCDHDDLFADFHGLRHLFISSLERAGCGVRGRKLGRNVKWTSAG